MHRPAPSIPGASAALAPSFGPRILETPMIKDRLTAFTDGVLAVIITIMVLEMKPPQGATLAALAALWPVFLSYVLSFIYIGIYWNNHHHFFHLVEKVDGAILWANLHLLFWLSLIPFATSWLGEHPFQPGPTALYGASLLAAAIAWWIMQTVIIREQGPHSPLRRALGRDLKGKLSPLIYLAGMGLAFVAGWISDLLYFAVALMWLVPDRRVERRLPRAETRAE
jgi:uncharacterized membrane protein